MHITERDVSKHSVLSDESSIVDVKYSVWSNFEKSCILPCNMCVFLRFFPGFSLSCL